MSNPQFPIYIPSKSRSDEAPLPRYFDRIGVPFKLVVEEHQYESYRQFFTEEQILILDPQFQKDYETLDDVGEEKSKGAGPARNFAWDHAIKAGFDWHWVMDDNICYMSRATDNTRMPVSDGTVIAAMEDFTLRYKNVAMSGPRYENMQHVRRGRGPFQTGSRIYSCNFIRNSLPYRWRGRYNEDTDLSIMCLKGGWTTIEFNAFLQRKLATQVMKGGNTEAFYAEEGTFLKSQMLVQTHPDVARLMKRYGRWHHWVNYDKWRKRPLIKDPSYKPPEKNPYTQFKLVDKRVVYGGVYRDEDASDLSEH